MTDQNFTMFSGDSKSLIVSIVDDDGNAVDVSTAIAISYSLSTHPNETAAFTKTLVSGISVATSTVTITIDATDTAALVGLYYHELQITDVSSLIYTAFSGWITIVKDLIA